MIASVEFYDAIKEWQQCAELAEQAEAERNYHEFQAAFREARRKFTIIRDAITEGLHTTMGSDEQEQLVTTTRNWDKLTEKIDVWKNEMAKEADDLRKKNARGKKVAKGYGAKNNNAGTNFRLRAT